MDCFLTTPLSLPSPGCQPKLGGHQQLSFLSEDRELSPCPSSQPPLLQPEPSLSLPLPPFLLPPQFFPTHCRGAAAGGDARSGVAVPAGRASAPRPQPSQYTLRAWLLVQAPTYLPAPWEVPRLENRKGGCRREKGTQDTRVSTLGRTPGKYSRAQPATPLQPWACCEQSPFIKQASPCRCLCCSLIFKLKKQLKES